MNKLRRFRPSVGRLSWLCLFLSLVSLGTWLKAAKANEAFQPDLDPDADADATPDTEAAIADTDLRIEDVAPEHTATPELSTLSAPISSNTNAVVSAPVSAPVSELAAEPVSAPVSELAAEPVSVSVSELETESLSQVTSVSQLSDVQPTDWAFQALQSLVERYGVIAGYPDGTYRGDRALTRYEFAAGLNAALDRINELIAAGLGDTVSREDLTTLQRLQTEFGTELAILRGRIDAVESRTAELEANQFSTTTQLSGEVIFSLGGATGGYPGADNEDATPAVLSNTGGAAGEDAQIVFNNRVRLNLSTSFTGRDLLITGLQAHNFGGGFGNTTGSIPGTLGLGDPVFGTASNASLSYAPQFGATNPSDLTNNGANDIDLYKLLYIFPASNDVTLFVGTNAEVSDAFPAVSPFASDSQGAISRFAGYNAAARVSGGMSNTGLAAAAGFIWNISDEIDLRALYGSVNAGIPNNAGLTGGTPLGAGLFNGSYVVAAQLTARPSDNFTIGLNYANSYHQINLLGTGLTSADLGSVVFSPNADQLAAVGGNEGLAVVNEGIRLNSIGATLNWEFAPKVSLTASGAYIFADLVNVDASTNFVSWMAGLHFQDILGEGNSAGLLFGQPLNRTSVGGDAINPETADPYHLEGYFNIRVNDNINITPGVFVLFNPEGYSGNDTTAVGVVRTTFRF